MVLKVPPDSRQVRDNRDPALLQQIGVTDPGELEQLRRADRAGGEQHLAPRIGALSFAARGEPHAARALAVEDDAACDCVGDDGQIRAARGRREITVHRAAAQAVAAAYLQRCRALGKIGVVIGNARVAGLDAGFDEGV